MRLPDFICVGPARTGTTWLHAALTGHVGLPMRVKETKFWGPYYDKGLQWYADHFRHCDRSQPVGEICPYFRTPEARTRIAQHLPNCKIIVNLRDPVERSYSQYRLMRKMGVVDGSFEEALSHPRIVETNHYASHLRGWIDLFGTGNVKVLLFDDLKTQPQKFLNEACDFIGIARIPLAEKIILDSDVNSFRYQPRSRRISRRVTRVMDALQGQRAYRTINFLERIGLWEFLLTSSQPFSAISPGTARELRERLIPEIEALETLIGVDLKAWKQPGDTFRSAEAERRQKAPSGAIRREIAAILLALIPLATGAVPDGLDLGTMRFSTTPVNSILEDTDDSVDDFGLCSFI